MGHYILRESSLNIRLLIFSLLIAFPTIAGDVNHSRVQQINSQLKYEGYFIEATTMGVMLVSDNDKFTLMLDNENAIWFDDSFVLSTSQKKLLLPKLLKLFESVENKEGKAVLASLIKASM